MRPLKNCGQFFTINHSAGNTNTVARFYLQHAQSSYIACINLPFKEPFELTARLTALYILNKNYYRKFVPFIILM